MESQANICILIRSILVGKACWEYGIRIPQNLTIFPCLVITLVLGEEDIPTGSSGAAERTGRMFSAATAIAFVIPGCFANRAVGLRPLRRG